MSGNNSSLDAMDDMIKTLTQIAEVQRGVAESLKRQYDIVGQEWDDSQYQRLGNQLEEVYKPLSESYVATSEAITRTQLSRRLLEEYLNAR